jgi:hypothetical protein
MLTPVIVVLRCIEFRSAARVTRKAMTAADEVRNADIRAVYRTEIHRMNSTTARAARKATTKRRAVAA